MSLKKYNTITLIIFPIILTIISVLIFIGLHLYMNKPTYDEELVNDNTTISKLYPIATIEKEDFNYIVYSLCDDEISKEDEYLIAFRGETVEMIEKIVNDNDNKFIENISYWQSNEIQDVKDFSIEDVIIEYVDLEVKEENVEHVNKLLKDVRIYDLNSYIGYEEETGVKLVYLVEITLGIYLLQFTLIIIGIEIAISLLLRLTIFRNKLKK